MSPPSSKDKVIVLDNGAYTAKVGLASAAEPRIIPNCMMKVKNDRRRAYIGDQIKDCTDTSGLYYMLAYQRGYLIKWDIQKTVWDYIFGPECLGVEGSMDTMDVILTEPFFNFIPIQDGLAELFFEDYQVQGLLLTPAPDFASFAWDQKKEKPEETLCVLVVDCGYSFTHIVPYIDGQRIDCFIKRIDVGGKFLTNYLTEIISYRQLNVTDETYVMNQVKEDACYVSMDFKADMATVAQKGNSIVKEYVLPDYYTVKRGFVRDPVAKPDPNEQVLRLGNERFTVPEILFHPSDVGMNQKGIPEAIVEVIQELCPEQTRFMFFENILLTGGCAKFPNFKERLEAEVRTLANEIYSVKIHVSGDPVVTHWRGAAEFAGSSDYESMKMTRKDYEEQGAARAAAAKAASSHAHGQGEKRGSESGGMDDEDEDSG